MLCSRVLSGLSAASVGGFAASAGAFVDFRSTCSSSRLASVCANVVVFAWLVAVLTFCMIIVSVFSSFSMEALVPSVLGRFPVLVFPFIASIFAANRSLAPLPFDAAWKFLGLGFATSFALWMRLLVWFPGGIVGIMLIPRRVPLSILLLCLRRGIQSRSLLCIVASLRLSAVDVEERFP